jgi:hypothetical protein
VVGYPEELRLGPTNADLLKQISQVSGGRYQVAPDQIFDPGDRRARAVTQLWPHLIMEALALLVFDVALRRIDFSLWRRS